MSGIVGWIDFARDLTSREEVLMKMTQTMVDRGPADLKTWISKNAGFGYRGTSASGLNGGMHVIAFERGECVVSNYAGTISNLNVLADELNSKGYRCKKGSGSEVLLYAYLHWGINLIEKIFGAFTFAIWDGRIRQLLLGRDRLGVKPLYYFQFSQGILFASEPKGIMANPLFTARLHSEAIPILLQPRLALSGETPLSGLKEVPVAHLIRYSKAGLSSCRYWQLISEHHSDSHEKTALHIRSLLEEIITSELSLNEQFGAMLSGGIDSTCVAAIARKTLCRTRPEAVLNTFCVEFENNASHFKSSELRPDVDAPFAQQAADFIGTKHRTVTVSRNDILNALPATRHARDLPAWGQFDASMYLLFQQMRKNCTVAFSGEAADEIFGGYPYLFKPELINRDHFPWLGDGPRLSGYLSKEIQQHVKPGEDELARYHQLLSEVPRLLGENPENARMREVLYLGMSGPLQVVLDRKDRMSSAVGLDVRLPFCDHRLVQYVWNIPWSMKSAGGMKGLLKTTMADLLPDSTLNRKKSAYPHFQDPTYENGLFHEAIQIVNDASSFIHSLFDIKALKEWIVELSTSKKNARNFPGGASSAYMLVHLVEVNRWINDYKVSF